MTTLSDPLFPAASFPDMVARNFQRHLKKRQDLIAFVKSRWPLSSEQVETQYSDWFSEKNNTYYGPERPHAVECPACRHRISPSAYQKYLGTCVVCNHHFRLTPEDRIRFILDPDTFLETAADITSANFLGFTDKYSYDERLENARKTTGRNSALVIGTAQIEGNPVNVGVMDFHFLGGSIGSVFGEKFGRLIALALKNRHPVILFTASGGCRMQEGSVALMQMAKCTVLLNRLEKAKIPFITVLCDPTTGGTAASIAMLGDIVMAESNALISFAGPRVIKNTIGATLPEDFQRAQTLLQNGMIDMMHHRRELKEALATLCILFSTRPVPPLPRLTFRLGLKNNRFLPCEKPLQPLIETLNRLQQEEAEKTHSRLLLITRKRLRKRQTRLFERLSPLDRLALVRHPNRIDAHALCLGVFDRFTELHGDRTFRDDPAIIGGLAALDHHRVMVIGHRKGHTTEENIQHRFGMPNPEGYRKAHRLMKKAEKFNMPVITFVNTPGAYPGAEAEERGQMIAIADNLRLMSDLKVPVIAFIVGEGGSGGALALCLANKIHMFELSTLSVISPEGCAAILYNDTTKTGEAMKSLKISAGDNLLLGIADGIIREPAGGAHHNWVDACTAIKAVILRELAYYETRTSRQIIAERRQKYQKIGFTGP